MTPSPRQTLKRGTHRLSRGCLMCGRGIELLADFGTDRDFTEILQPICPCGSLTRLVGVSVASGTAS
jgi:hypothetical protein